jgi:phage host-nuclease inhibitor protein Gam
LKKITCKTKKIKIEGKVQRHTKVKVEVKNFGRLKREVNRNMTEVYNVSK